MMSNSNKALRKVIEAVRVTANGLPFPDKLLTLNILNDAEALLDADAEAPAPEPPASEPMPECAECGKPRLLGDHMPCYWCSKFSPCGRCHPFTPAPAPPPEATCERCQRPNVWSWHAPSPLWNAVMRNPETGEDRYSVVCPPCFAELVSEKGIGQEINGAARLVWCFKPHDDEVAVAALWKDGSGRRWNPETCLWEVEK